MSSRAAVETAGEVSRAHLGAVGSQLRVPVCYDLRGAVAQPLLRSELPAPVSDEGCEIGRRDSDGVQEADVRKLVLVA